MIEKHSKFGSDKTTAAYHQQQPVVSTSGWIGSRGVIWIDLHANSSRFWFAVVSVCIVLGDGSVFIVVTIRYKNFISSDHSKQF